MLAPEGCITNNAYKPTPMQTPFTTEEIKKAPQSLKNNKSPGVDKIPAELIKYAPDKTFETISEIFNEMAETGENPKEIEIGILNPLPKPNKIKGPPENLRPIILLSVIRKILTICLITRTYERFPQQIPNEQAAYQGGRSTTEQVFTIKMLVEKAINASDYTIYILLLDMSKAFDTVDRKKLFELFEKFLSPDELHLLSILSRCPKIQVKVAGKFGEFFNTLLGIMKGDVLSAILFIYYLACCLGKETTTYLNKMLFAPKYADHITYATNNKRIYDELQHRTSTKLKSFNLLVNSSKTEYYQVPKPIPEPPKPSMEELLAHRDDKILWSALDWLVNYTPASPKDDTPDCKKCKLH